MIDNMSKKILIYKVKSSKQFFFKNIFFCFLLNGFLFFHGQNYLFSGVFSRILLKLWGGGRRLDAMVAWPKAIRLSTKAEKIMHAQKSDWARVFNFVLRSYTIISGFSHQHFTDLKKFSIFPSTHYVKLS